MQAVSTLNGVPYFGGHFFKYTSIPVNQLVRTDPVTGVLDQSWLPNVTAGFLGVFAVRGFNANLYVGGDFTRVAQTKQLNFAQWTDNAVSASIDVGVSLADAPDPVDAGSSLTYTATVTNAGPDAAAGVALTDNLPASATFVSASPSCTYSSGTHSVSCDLGTIAAGGSTAPTITVTPGSAGSLNNTVNVTAVGNDPNAANNSSSASTTVNAVAGADLNLTMSPANAAKIDQGSTFSYVLTVLNQGPDSDPSVTVTDTLPGNVTPAGAATTTAGSCSGTTTVTCALGAMNANGVATITIPVTAPAQPQTVVNTASVDGLANDPDHGDDEVVRFNAVKDPALGGDTTAPSRTATQMFDVDADGFVDQVVVTFSENLAVCPAPCTSGWVLTNVPSGSSLQSVSIAGNQAILSIGNEQNQPDTAVGLFRVQLATPNQIQDAAGNRSVFSAVAPTDKASPVAVGFRKGHNSSGVCNGAPSNGGVAEPCDELTSEWSEALLPSSIPSTANLTITDPAGSGNDLLTDQQLHPGFDGHQVQQLRHARHRYGVVGVVVAVAPRWSGAGHGDRPHRGFVHRDGLRIVGLGRRRHDRVRAGGLDQGRRRQPGGGQLHEVPEDVLSQLVTGSKPVRSRNWWPPPSITCSSACGSRRVQAPWAVIGTVRSSRAWASSAGSVPSSVPTRWISSTNEGSDHSDHKVHARLRIDCRPKSITVAGG